jgi:hypothetical protein
MHCAAPKAQKYPCAHTPTLLARDFQSLLITEGVACVTHALVATAWVSMLGSVNFIDLPPSSVRFVHNRCPSLAHCNSRGSACPPGADDGTRLTRWWAQSQRPRAFAPWACSSVDYGAAAALARCTRSPAVAYQKMHWQPSRPGAQLCNLQLELCWCKRNVGPSGLRALPAAPW